MNEIIVLNRNEFTSLINEISYKAGKASATEVLAQIKKKQEDKISKEEALSLLHVKPDKLAKMRENREILYYSGTRPYLYSRQSIQDYLASVTVSTKLIKNRA